MITVLAWFWQQPGGRTTYRAWHVNVWADMVRRNLTTPHRIACVTSESEGIDPSIEIIAPPRDFENVRIPSWKEHRPQCLRRLAMFRPDAAATFGERFVCMDLDCVITGPLDPLFTGHDFRIFRGTSPNRPYNGSMFMLRAGARPRVYAEFTPERAADAGRRFLGSDQAWITHCLGPDETTWGPEDGVHWSGDKEVRDESRLLFFPGSAKPWDMLETPAIAEHYRRENGGHGLVLGHRPGVWQEARAALKRHRFDGVIACPDVAEKWPVDVDAVFESSAQARQLVRALGFNQVTECGVRSKIAA